MKITALLYIEKSTALPDSTPIPAGSKDLDTGLSFEGMYLPDELKKRLQSMNIFTSYYYAVPSGYSGKLSDSNIIKTEEKDDVSFWKKIFEISGADHIVRIFCDSPFLDPEIISDMVNVHTGYLAEFTYSENLPSGLSCEIISRELIDDILLQNEKTLSLSQTIRSNINRFDVELYYKEPDIRNMRLSFRSGDPREKTVMSNILAAAGGIPAYKDIKKIIDSNPGAIYLAPSYAEIELTGRCDLDCIFCFRKILKNSRADMSMDIYRKILRDMGSFNLPYSICFGGSGEPLMHSSFFEVIDIALKENRIKNIVLETNGILAGDNFRSYIKNNKDNRFKIIFNVNGMDEDTYKHIHGGNYFNQVFTNITGLKEIAGDNIYIQIMKINETEAFLDKYYDFWDRYKIPVILQKQNTYTGRIADRTYSDLSPLERTPCWHLQRDINILSDGTVTFCKQDVDGECARGNMNTGTLDGIFAKSKDSFLKDFSKNHASSHCASCDEWYTFNL